MRFEGLALAPLLTPLAGSPLATFLLSPISLFAAGRRLFYAPRFRVAPTSITTKAQRGDQSGSRRDADIPTAAACRGESRACGLGRLGSRAHCRLLESRVIRRASDGPDRIQTCDPPLSSYLDET